LWQAAAKWQRMAIAVAPTSSVRFERAEFSRLAWAFIISICIHLFVWGGYEGGKSAIAWMEIHHPDWLKTLKKLALPSLTTQQDRKEQQKMSEPPLMFVDVNPAVATDEAPPKAKFESDKNSRAANPEPDRETGVPK